MRNGTATRDKIRQAALELFVQRGVDAVAVKDITAAVGVRQGTLYVHWPSKDALIAELFHDGFKAYGIRIIGTFAERGPIRDRITRLVQTICALHDADETLFAFLLLTQHRNLATIPHDDTYPIDLILREIENALNAGELAPADPILLTSAVLGTIVHAATFRLYRGTKRTMTDMAPELSTLCLRALGLQ